MFVKNYNLNKLGNKCKGALFIMSCYDDEGIKQVELGVVVYIQYLQEQEICYHTLKQCVTYFNDTEINDL